MRLIDADKIDYIMGEKPSSLDYVRRAHIADEPTVDAIPVEWLKLKIDTVLNVYPNGNNETEVLCKLLYDWEKENE